MGVAQSGSAFGLGPKGRRFESCHPHQWIKNKMKTAQEKQGHIATILILCFTAGAMLAHAWYQPLFNELDLIEAEIEAYRNNAVIGWWKMDRVTKELYFEEK